MRISDWSSDVCSSDLQQLDPVYVDVTQSSTDLIRLKREMASGKLQSVKDGGAPVRLYLEDGSEYPEAGLLQFSEVSVSTTTGSVTLRAVFHNPQKLLLSEIGSASCRERGCQYG